VKIARADAYDVRGNRGRMPISDARRPGNPPLVTAEDNQRSRITLAIVVVSFASSCSPIVNAGVR
jgi:hypothetical protein